MVSASDFDTKAKAEAELCVQRALRHIQNAQNELGRACAELSSLTGGIPVWNLVGRLTDKVHAAWWRVEAFRKRGKYSLDAFNIEDLRRRAGGAK